MNQVISDLSGFYTLLIFLMIQVDMIKKY